MARHGLAQSGIAGSAQPSLKVRRVVRTWCDACDGSHPKFAPSGALKAEEFCGVQAVGCDGWCELRTRNHGLSLAKYRARAPPYQYSRRKDPDVLNIKSTYVSELTSVSDQFICALPIFTDVTPFHLLILSTTHVVAAQQAHLHRSKRRLRNSPPEDWAGCRAQALRAWPDATCCDGQCQGPQDAPSKTWPRYRAWTMHDLHEGSGTFSMRQSRLAS